MSLDKYLFVGRINHANMKEKNAQLLKITKHIFLPNALPTFYWILRITYEIYTVIPT